MTTTTLSKAKQLERFIDALGLRYFAGREFTPYWSRSRRGVRNGVPPEVLWRNVIPVLVVLDHFRHAHGAPVSMTSTYRRPAYNAVLPDTAPDSYHMDFVAIDFQSTKGTPAQWAARLDAMRGKRYPLPSGQGLIEFRGGIGIYDTFCHVDTRGYDFDWDRRKRR